MIVTFPDFCLQERVERRGRPATANNDIELRNLQQELLDKNKVYIQRLCLFSNLKI